MNRHGFAVAFAVGLAVVVWVGAGFVASASGLAVLMTLVIAGVYVLGALELRQFRASTAALNDAVASLAEPLADLVPWLERVPAVLRQPVRLRIEGERVGLPGPALTPYWVGLLVMLGMLGTFLGMVVTFKGAVFALEGSADLHAVRAALAEPIKGLGLSFGTSVAGVAASAMLGLMSALSRRERADAVRSLDARAATVLRAHSRAHQREASFKALQAQAQAWPQALDKMQALMDGMERRNQQLNEQLLGQQSQFHREVGVSYTALAQSVGTSLKDSLTASATAAGASLQPVVQAAMAEVAQESARRHQQLMDAAQTQLSGLSSAFSDTARGVSAGWVAALDQHAQANVRHAEGLDRSLVAFSAAFEQRSAALLGTVSAQLAGVSSAFGDTAQGVSAGWTAALAQSAQTHARQADGLDRTLSAFTASFEQGTAALLRTVSDTLAGTHTAQAASDAQRLAGWTQTLEHMATSLHSEWQRTGAQTLAQQQAACLALEQTAGDIAERASLHASQTLGEMTRLLTQSEELIRARQASEATWAAQQGERMDQLSGVWRSELGALRDAEAVRGDAAVARLGELQSALAGHLGTLGTALEAPMTRLIQTASEAPQAAAEVIVQLRQEMTRFAERDAQALAERNAVMAEIGTLLHTLNRASGEQQAAIESLVTSAQGVLAQAGSQFADTLGTQAGHAAEAAAQVAGSAIELASVGESFHQGIQLFSASNDKLMASLQRIEATLQQSMARSDEQLAYYVAQAREVIDLSISAQEGIVDDLRQLRTSAAAEVA
jgi:hypothetical protein